MVNYLEEPDFRELELAVATEVQHHLEMAAHWREKHIEQNFQVFDELATRHEETAAAIRRGWSSVVRRLTS
jgi:rubrerythrin